MNKYQIAKHQSNQLVVKEARSNQASVDLIPSFAKGIDALDEINADIEKVKVQQFQNIKGISTEKDNQISELIAILIDVSGAMLSYATRTKNSVLKEKVDYNVTSISKMNFMQLTSMASVMLEQARLLTEDVFAEEGITIADIDALETILNAVKASKLLPRAAIIDRLGHTDSLSSLLAKAQAIIVILDRLATQYKRKDPTFYLKYKTARTVSVSSPHKANEKAA